MDLMNLEQPIFEVSGGCAENGTFKFLRRGGWEVAASGRTCRDVDDGVEGGCTPIMAGARNVRILI